MLVNVHQSDLLIESDQFAIENTNLSGLVGVIPSYRIGTVVASNVPFLYILGQWLRLDNPKNTGEMFTQVYDYKNQINHFHLIYWLLSTVQCSILLIWRAVKYWNKFPCWWTFQPKILTIENWAWNLYFFRHIDKQVKHLGWIVALDSNIQFENQKAKWLWVLYMFFLYRWEQ